MAYSEEEILDELERISEEYSDPPTWKEIKANGNIGPETICNRLNKSWTEILSDMHFEHNRTKQKGLKTWSKEEFIEEVNKTIPEIEGTIQVSDVSENMESFTRYYERWSMTWREVLEECGVYQEKIPSVLWTEEEKKEWLDDKLEKHTQECDGFPYKKDFAKEYGKTHWIYEFYSSWREAIPEEISKEGMAEEIKSMSEGNIPPTQKEFLEGSNYSKNHIQYFGWVSLLRESGFEYNARYSGENHHNWKGGKNRYYGPYWSKRREKVIERDGNKCRLCGETEDIHVHHITPARLFGKDYRSMNELSNLVCLCRECHYNWEGRFTNSNHSAFVEKCLEAQKREDCMSLFEC